MRGLSLFSRFIFTFSLVAVMNISVLAGDLYKVIYVKGKSMMEREGEKRKIFKGDFLLAGDIIRSEDNSLLILGFGEGYRSRMKVGPMSDITLEGQVADPDDKKIHKTQFFVKVGNILVDYINKDKDKNRLKVRTRTASMGIRGTEFFVYSAPDGSSLFAVKSGVVLAKSNEEKSGVPLTSEEGIVYTTDGDSGVLTPPKWYQDINWEVHDTSLELEQLLHNKALDKISLDALVSKVLKVENADLSSANLSGEPKELQAACEKGKAEKCKELALYIMKHGKIEDTKPIVTSLFNKACMAKDEEACVWVGRLAYELDSDEEEKQAGLSHIKKHCESYNAYACYTMWEILKSGDGDNDEEANKYLQKSLSILNGLENYDEALADFSKACDTENAVACLNYGILLEQVAKKDEAKKIYEKGCKLGSGGACSNFGYMLQSESLLEEAKKNYTKSCFLDEAFGCYNLSCLYSKESKIDLSKQYLKMAISGGFLDWEQIGSDSDLTNLRASSNYETFIKDLKASYATEK